MRTPSANTAGFNVLLGARLRALRERAGRSQEQVASTARLVGLRWWTRNLVAQVERGVRELFPVELAVLPTILQRNGITRLDGEPLMLDDLLRGGGQDDLLTPDLLVQWGTAEAARSRPTSPTLRRWATRIFTHKPLEIIPGERLSVAAVLEHLAERIESIAQEDAVVKLAASPDLRLPPVALACACLAQWGRGLTDERERRLTTQGLTPRQVQARRGHLTRELLDELRPLIAGPSKRSRKAGPTP